MTTMQEYRDFVAARTIYPGSGTLIGALYCGLKMAGEAGELLEHQRMSSGEDLVLKEAGDVLWYVIASERELGFNLRLVSIDFPHWLNKNSGEDWADWLCIAVSRYTEALGKAMRDDGFNGGTLDPQRQAKLQAALEEAIIAIAGVGHAYGKALHEIADINIAKLKDRDARGVTKGDGDNR